MKQISIGAGLSNKYTNHCGRAAAMTLWSDSCVPARHIMSISGHANEQSLASYNRRPSNSQLKNCSDISLCRKVELPHRQQPPSLPSGTRRVPLSHRQPWFKFLRILPYMESSTAVILARHRCSCYRRMRPKAPFNRQFCS